MSFQMRGKRFTHTLCDRPVVMPGKLLELPLEGFRQENGRALHATYAVIQHMSWSKAIGGGDTARKEKDPGNFFPVSLVVEAGL